MTHVQNLLIQLPVDVTLRVTSYKKPRDQVATDVTIRRTSRSDDTGNKVMIERERGRERERERERRQRERKTEAVAP